MFRAMMGAWLRGVGRGIKNSSGFSACSFEERNEELGNEKSEHARFAGLCRDVGPDSSEETLSGHGKLVAENLEIVIPQSVQPATA